MRRIIVVSKQLVKVKASCEEILINIESDCDDKLCSSVVSMENVGFVEAMYMVASGVREYQQVQGLHIDPTVDVDSDDFQEPSASHGILASWRWRMRRLRSRSVGSSGCNTFIANE